jgi:hypothetical protein
MCSGNPSNNAATCCCLVSCCCSEDIARAQADLTCEYGMKHAYNMDVHWSKVWRTCRTAVQLQNSNSGSDAGRHIMFHINCAAPLCCSIRVTVLLCKAC